MYPITDAVKKVLQSPHQPVSAHVDVTRAGQIIPGFFWIPLADLSITVDRASQNRRTGKLSIVDTTGKWRPTKLTDPIAANGNEMRVYVDIYDPGTNTVLQSIPVGVYTIVTVTVTDSGVDYTIDVTLSDRSWALQKRGFIEPYTVQAGVNVDDAIRQMISTVWQNNGPLVFALQPTSVATPSPAVVLKPETNQQRDPWTNAVRLAQSAGFELFFDVNGFLVGRPPVDPTRAPAVWDFTEQQITGTKSIQWESTRENVYSAWIVVGKGQTAQTLPSGLTSYVNKDFVSVIVDSNPSSPTYAYGPFGIIPQAVKSTLVTNTDQGDDVGETMQRQNQGLAEGLTITTLPNPALDVDDVVHVHRSRMNIDGYYVVESLSLQLSPQSQEMSVKLRAI